MDRPPAARNIALRSRLQIHLSNSPRSQSCAARCRGAGPRLISVLRRPEVRGRGTPGPRGPTDLEVSRSRGLAISRQSGCAVTASLPVPPASRARRLRLAPHTPGGLEPCDGCSGVLPEDPFPPLMDLGDACPLVTGLRHRHQEARMVRSRRTGTECGLGRRGGGVRLAPLNSHHPGHRSRSKATDVAASLDGSRRMQLSPAAANRKVSLTKM